MKKVWIVSLFLLAILGLTGCIEPVNEDLTKLTVEVVSLDGEVLFKSLIDLPDETVEDVAAFLDEAISLDYQVFDFGVFVKGIAGFYPKEHLVTYNYFFSLYVNDEMSQVGINQVELEEGMIISFRETTSLDDTDLWVDQLINQFIELHLETYISESLIDYYVASALFALKNRNYDVAMLNDMVSFENAWSLIEASDLENIGQALKFAVIMDAYQQPLEDQKATFEALESSNPYAITSLLTLLSIVKSDTADQLATTLLGETTFNDPDLAGMSLMALSLYDEHEAYEIYIQAVTSYLSQQLSTTGILSWGASNSASTATVVLGLVAHGLNPRSEIFTFEGVDLIEALKMYEENATFKWHLDNDQPDLAFSTPQAFAALVAYKLFRDQWGNPPFSLFIRST